MLPYRNIHKNTWTAPDKNNNSQIDYILIDRWHSSILDIRSLTGADCDTVHYLVVEKVRERLAVNKQVTQTFHVERFNFRKLMSCRLGNIIRLEDPKQVCTLEKLNGSET